MYLFHLVWQYLLLGKNKKCDTSSIYTDKHGCNGWKLEGAEKCREKCSNNEVPDQKCQKGKVCAYALYTDLPNNPWCHLADDSCNMIEGDKQHVLYQKGLLLILTGLTIN